MSGGGGANAGTSGWVTNLTIPTPVSLIAVESGGFRIIGENVSIFFPNGVVAPLGQQASQGASPLQQVPQGQSLGQQASQGASPLQQVPQGQSLGQQFAPVQMQAGQVPQGQSLGQQFAPVQMPSPSFSYGTFANLFGAHSPQLPQAHSPQLPQAHSPQLVPLPQAYIPQLPPVAHQQLQNLQDFGIPIHQQIGGHVTQILAIPVDPNGAFSEEVAQALNPLLNQGVDYAPAQTPTDHIKQLSLTQTLTESQVNYLLTNHSLAVTVPTGNKPTSGLFMHPINYFQKFTVDRHKAIVGAPGYGTKYTLVEHNLTYAVSDMVDESNPEFIIRRRRYRKNKNPGSNEPEPSKFLCHYMRVPKNTPDDILVGMGVV